MIGFRVPELFRQAGLDDVGVEVRAQMYPPGNTRRTIRLDLAELDELDAAARAHINDPHINDPHTVVLSGLLYLTWGRKPTRTK